MATNRYATPYVSPDKIKMSYEDFKRKLPELRDIEEIKRTILKRPELQEVVPGKPTDDDAVQLYLAMNPQIAMYVSPGYTSMQGKTPEQRVADVFNQPIERKIQAFRKAMAPPLYEEYGKPNVFKQFWFNIREGARTTISETPSLAAAVFDDAKWLSDVAEDMRRWGNKRGQEIIENDLQLQGYQQWIEDEPVSFKNFFRPDMIGRGLAQALPSILEMAAVTYATGGIGKVLKWSPKAMRIAGSVARIGTMAALEGGGIHKTAMNYYEDYAKKVSVTKHGTDKYWEKYFDLDKARDTAALSYAIYAPIAGLLENMSFDFMFGLTKTKGMASRTLGEFVTKRVARGLKSASALQFLEGAAMSGVTESVQEWSQYMAEQLVSSAWQEGYGNTPGEAADNLAKMVTGMARNWKEVWQQHAWDPEARESFFSGIYLAPLGGLSKQAHTLSPKNVLEEMREAREKYIKDKYGKYKKYATGIPISRLTKKDISELSKIDSEIVESKMRNMNEKYKSIWLEKIDYSKKWFDKKWIGDFFKKEDEAFIEDTIDRIKKEEKRKSEQSFVENSDEVIDIDETVHAEPGIEEDISDIQSKWNVLEPTEGVDYLEETIAEEEFIPESQAESVSGEVPEEYYDNLIDDDINIIEAARKEIDKLIGSVPVERKTFDIETIPESEIVIPEQEIPGPDSIIEEVPKPSEFVVRKTTEQGNIGDITIKTDKEDGIKNLPTNEIPPDYQRADVSVQDEPVLYDYMNTPFGQRIQSDIKIKYPQFDYKVVNDLIKENGIEAYGKQFSAAVTWSKYGKYDTPPHEAFHGIMKTINNHPIVQQAIKKFGDEEKLTQYVGEYYAGRLQDNTLKTRLKTWLQQFWITVKKIFGNISEDDATQFISESFFRGNILDKLTIDITKQQYEPVVQYQKADIDDDNARRGSEIELTYQPDSRSMLYSFSRNFMPFVSGMKLNETINVYQDLLSRVDKSDNISDFETEYKDWVSKNFKEDFKYSEDDIRWMKDFFKVRKSSQRVYQPESGGEKVLWELILRPTGFRTYGLERFNITRLKDYTTISENGSMRSLSDYAIKSFIDERSDTETELKYHVLPGSSIYVHRKGTSRRTGRDYDFYADGSNALTAGIIRDVENSLFNNWLYGKVKSGDEIIDVKTPPIVFIASKGADNSQLITKTIPNYLLESEIVKEIRSITDEILNKSNLEPGVYRYLLSERESMVKEFAAESREKLVQYLDDEITHGNINEEIKATMLESSDKNALHSPYVYLSQIVRHKFLKGVTFNKFLMPEYWKSTRNFLDRLKIPFAAGYTPYGLNNILETSSVTADVMLIPKDTVVRVGKEEDVYDSFDGTMYTSSRLMRSIGNITGTKYSDIGKFSIYKRSQDGENYLAFKMSNQTPKVGMQFFRKGETTPFVEVRKDTKTGNTYFYNLETNEEFDMIASDNEAKVRAGEYAGEDSYYKKISLDESNIKILFQEDEIKSDIAFGTRITEWMLNPEYYGKNESFKNFFSAYREFADRKFGEIKTYMDNVRNGQLRELRDLMHKDIQEGIINTELQEWLEEDPTGSVFVNRSILKQVMPFFSNSVIKSGFYKLRDKNTRMLVLSPAIGEGIERGTYKMSVPVNLSEEQKELAKNAIIGRQPISSSTSLRTYEFAGFSEEDTDVPRIYLHKDDVKEVLDGDWDIDEAMVFFGDKKLAQALKDLAKTPEYQSMFKPNILEIFGKRTDIKSSDSIANYDNLMDAYTKQAKTNGAIGRVVNAIVTFHNLAWKDIRVKIEDKTYTVHKPNDVVVMNYAPLLKDEVLSNWDKIHNLGDSIVTKDKNGKYVAVDKESLKGIEGDIFLQTTYDHVLSIWLSAAVDDKKWDLLSKWDYSADKLIVEAFDIKDVNDKQTKKDMRILRSVIAYFNTGRRSNGRDLVDNRNLYIDGIVSDSKELMNVFQSSSLRDPKNFTREIIGFHAKRARATGGLSYMNKEYNRVIRLLNSGKLLIEHNYRMTPGEYIVTRIGDYVNRTENSNIYSTNNPLEYSPEIYQNSHIDAVVELEKSISQTLDKYADKKAKKGKASKEKILLEIKNNAARYILPLSKEFYEKFKTEEDATKANVDYNEEMLSLVQKYKPQFDKLSKAEKVYATLHFLWGKPSWQKRGSYIFRAQHLLPKALMDSETVILYSRIKLGRVREYLDNFKTIKNYRLEIPSMDEIVGRYVKVETFKEMKEIDKTIIDEILNIRC